MGIEHEAIALSIIIGLFVWVILIFNVPGFELYFRSEYPGITIDLLFIKNHGAPRR